MFGKLVFVHIYRASVKTCKIILCALIILYYRKPNIKYVVIAKGVA